MSQRPTRIGFETGVIGQCDECDETAVLRVSARDMLGVPVLEICRSCWEGSADRGSEEGGER